MNKIILPIIIIFLVIIGTSVYFISSISQEPYGYWKPDKESDQKLLQQMEYDFPEEFWKLEIKNYEGDTTFFHYRATMIERKDVPIVEDKITEFEAKNIAMKFVSNHSDFFGIEPAKQPKIMEVKKEWEIIFKPQEYKRMTVNEPLGYSGIVVLYHDGQLKTATFSWFKNISVPSYDKDLGRWEDHEDVCDSATIYPIWNPDKEYWTYHRVRNCGGQYIDTQNGNILFEYNIID